jgi:hypothetical protein
LGRSNELEDLADLAGFAKAEAGERNAETRSEGSDQLHVTEELLEGPEELE